MPYRPSLGSQKVVASSRGLRGNEPGGYGFPRSRTQTDLPASASRYAITEPPKPEPTTTASKCVWVTATSRARLTLEAARTLGGGNCHRLGLDKTPSLNDTGRTLTRNETTSPSVTGSARTLALVLVVILIAILPL